MEQIFCPTTRPLRLGIRTLHLFPGMAGKCQKGNNLPISSRPAHLQGCLYIVRNPCPSSLRCGGANLPARSHLCLFCSITLLAASHARRGERRFFLHHASVHFLENHQLANSQESATPLVCPELRDVSIYRHLTRVNDVFYSQNWLAAGFIPHPASFDGKPRPTESPYPDVDVASPNSLQTVIAASCSKPQISKRLITTDLEDPWGISQKTSQLKIVWAQNLETPSGTSQFATRVCSSARSRALAAFDKSACNGNADGWLPSGNVVMIAMENGHLVRWFTHEKCCSTVP